MIEFLENLRTVLKGSKYRSLPLHKMLGTFLPGIKAAQRSGHSIEYFGGEILIAFKEKKTITKGTAIERIASENDYQSDSKRVNDIVIFLIGGHDTTAYSLAWTLLELAKHPYERDILRNELKQLPIEERLDIQLVRRSGTRPKIFH